MSHVNIVDPLTHFQAVASASAQGGSADDILKALDPALNAVFGHKLYTGLLYHGPDVGVERYYSNQPETYLVGGRKPPNDLPWTQQLLVEGRPYIGYDANDIREVFFDHEIIFSLGCEAILNIPVSRRLQQVSLPVGLHPSRTVWHTTKDGLPAIIHLPTQFVL